MTGFFKELAAGLCILVVLGVPQLAAKKGDPT